MKPAGESFCLSASVPGQSLRALFFQHQLQRSLQTLLSGDAALNRKNAASTSLPAPFQLVQAPNHPLPAKQQSD